MWRGKKWRHLANTTSARWSRSTPAATGQGDGRFPRWCDEKDPHPCGLLPTEGQSTKSVTSSPHAVKVPQNKDSLWETVPACRQLRKRNSWLPRGPRWDPGTLTGNWDIRIKSRVPVGYQSQLPSVTNVPRDAWQSHEDRRCPNKELPHLEEPLLLIKAVHVSHVTDEPGASGNPIASVTWLENAISKYVFSMEVKNSVVTLKFIFATLWWKKCLNGHIKTHAWSWLKDLGSKRTILTVDK